MFFRKFLVQGEIHLADVPDVLSTVFHVKTQIGAAMTDIVTIKDKGSAAIDDMEPFFHGMGNGGFAGARKPCESEIHRFVFVQSLSTGLDLFALGVTIALS